MPEKDINKDTDFQFDIEFDYIERMLGKFGIPNNLLTDEIIPVSFLEQYCKNESSLMQGLRLCNAYRYLIKSRESSKSDGQVFNLIQYAREMKAYGLLCGKDMLKNMANDAKISIYPSYKEKIHNGLNSAQSSRRARLWYSIAIKLFEEEYFEEFRRGMSKTQIAKKIANRLKKLEIKNADGNPIQADSIRQLLSKYKK